MVVFFQWHFIDLFSCIAASLFNKITKVFEQPFCRKPEILQASILTDYGWGASILLARCPSRSPISSVTEQKLNRRHKITSSDRLVKCLCGGWSKTWGRAGNDVDGSGRTQVPETSGLVLRSTDKHAWTPRVQSIHMTWNASTHHTQLIVSSSDKCREKHQLLGTGENKDKCKDELHKNAHI